METQASSFISLLFIVLGVIFIKFRFPIGRKAAIVYKKIGIEVPEDLYAKQFVFIGILLMIVGFLGATGLITRL